MYIKMLYSIYHIVGTYIIYHSQFPNYSNFGTLWYCLHSSVQFSLTCISVCTTLERTPGDDRDFSGA